MPLLVKNLIMKMIVLEVFVMHSENRIVVGIFAVFVISFAGELVPVDVIVHKL